MRILQDAWELGRRVAVALLLENFDDEDDRLRNIEKRVEEKE